jgi:hypothetical protein
MRPGEVRQLLRRAAPEAESAVTWLTREERVAAHAKEVNWSLVQEEATKKHRGYGRRRRDNK